MNACNFNEEEAVEFFAMQLAPRRFSELSNGSVFLDPEQVMTPEGLKVVADRAMTEAYAGARALAAARSAIRRAERDKANEGAREWMRLQNLSALLGSFLKSISDASREAKEFTAEGLFHYIARQNRVGLIFGQEKALALEVAPLVEELRGMLEHKDVRACEIEGGVVRIIRPVATEHGVVYAVQTKFLVEVLAGEPSDIITYPCMKARIASLQSILELFYDEPNIRSKDCRFTREELWNFIALLGKLSSVFGAEALQTPLLMMKELRGMLRHIIDQGDSWGFTLSRSRTNKGAIYRLTPRLSAQAN